MATGYGICVHIVYGHRAIYSPGPRGQPRANPYRDYAEIVRKLCNVSTVAVQSPQPPHGNRTEPVRGSTFARCPGGDCAMPPTTYLRATVLCFFFKFVKLLAKPNRRGRGARESVRKSHSHLLPPQGGLAEAARKGGYGQDTGPVHPSQAKCELGIRRLVHLCRFDLGRVDCIASLVISHFGTQKFDVWAVYMIARTMI